MDINAILASMTGNTQQRVGAITQQADALAQDTASIAGLLNTNIAEGKQVVEQTAQIAAQEAAIDYKNRSTLERAAAVVGLNEDDQNNQLISSMAEYTAAEEQRKAARARYDELSSIGLLDNPIGYIMAQLELPQAAAVNNALVAKRDAASENIQTRQRILTAHKSAMVVNNAEAMRDVNLAKATVSKAAADIALRDAEAANISKLSGRKLQEFQHRNTIFAVQDAAFLKQLQVAQFQMSLEDRQQARAERAAIVEAKKKEQKDEEEFAAGLNVQFQRISQFMGLNTPMNYEIWKKIPDKTIREQWLAAGLSGKIGSDLLDSMRFLDSHGNTTALAQTNPGVSQAMRNFVNSLSSYQATELSAAKKMGKTPKIAELQEIANDKYMSELVTGASLPGSGISLTAPKWDTVFTPYRAQYKMLLQEAASGAIPPLKDNIVTKAATTVMETVDPSASNFNTETERVMLKTVAEMVRKGNVPINAAAQQVVDFYTVSALRNKELYQYDLFNLPAQTRYMAVIPGTSVYGKPIEADLMNINSVKKALAQLAAQRSRENSGSFFPGAAPSEIRDNIIRDYLNQGE